MGVNSKAFHILLIEDDEVDIQSIQRTLKKLEVDHQLDIARDGLEALNKLYTHKDNTNILPKIIILDINMPKMNGIEFLEKLRVDPHFDSIDVLITSTSNNYHDKAAVLELNIAGYFVKPLPQDEFLSLCKILLG